MKAVIQDHYGPSGAVTVGDLPEPVPADGEILIRVRAVSLNGSDREHLLGRPRCTGMTGLRRPRRSVPGSDVAGVVAVVGPAVTEFAPGDEVFGELSGYRGALAEYATTPPRLLVRKPADLSFPEAAAIPQACRIALKATRGLRPGDRVLVNGAGGAAGASVIGMAKHLGATVAAVDRADKTDHLRRIGADAAIAFEYQDWADHRDRYDRVVDLLGRRSPYRVHRALRAGGTYLMVGGHTRLLLATLLAGPSIRLATGKRVKVLPAPHSRADLEAATALVAEGVAVPAVDRLYPLEEAPEAFERLAAGDNQGKIVIEVL